MIILMDIGNSRCKWVLVESIDAYHPIDEGSWDNNDFEESLWHEKLSYFNQYALSDVVITSVASEQVKEKLTEICREKLRIHAVFAESSAVYHGKASILINSYFKPLALGVDRWLAMIGALELVDDKKYAVIDAGTAITLDVVINGQHQGGHIVPGARLMHKSLLGDTGRIAWGAQQDNEMTHQQWLGKNTIQAVEFGCFNATFGYIQAAVRRLINQYAIKTIVFTGGGSLDLLEQLKQDGLSEGLVHDDQLVLKGLHYWFYSKRAKI